MLGGGSGGAATDAETFLRALTFTYPTSGVHLEKRKFIVCLVILLQNRCMDCANTVAEYITNHILSAMNVGQKGR